jgi:hypothetical protein
MAAGYKCILRLALAIEDLEVLTLPITGGRRPSSDGYCPCLTGVGQVSEAIPQFTTPSVSTKGPALPTGGWRHVQAVRAVQAGSRVRTPDELGIRPSENADIQAIARHVDRSCERKRSHVDASPG